MALNEGDLFQATSRFEQALATSQDLGSSSGIAEAHTNLGDAAARRGAYHQAAAAYHQAVKYYRQASYQAGLLTCLERLADLAWLRSEAPQAVGWFAVAEAERGRSKLPRTPVERQRYERHLKAMREQMDQATFAGLWTAETTTTLDQALEQALEESTA